MFETRLYLLNPEFCGTLVGTVIYHSDLTRKTFIKLNDLIINDWKNGCDTYWIYTLKDAGLVSDFIFSDEMV